MRNIKIILAFIITSFCLHAYDYENYFSKVDTAAYYLKDKTNASPSLLIVLTAGVKGPIDEMTDKIEVSSRDIPYFPVAHAKGHEGTLIFGKLDGKEIVLMRGRYHYYERIDPQDVVFPYFVLNALGVKGVITMNAVGGIRHDLNAGDIMLVTDHINYLGNNSLRGLSIQFPEKQFTSMTDGYSKEYQQLAKKVAQELCIELKEGIYLATMGPNYETPAEIKMFRSFGADTVGMSTLFEVLACNFLNMKVLTFSCISNPAADRHSGVMTHEEVLEAMQNAGEKITKLTNYCAKEILKK